MDGFILINKPSGPTSHDVVDELRALTGISQIGHAGTLDPLAEGLLILLVGNFTKRAEKFLKLPKEYEAVLRLGFESDTHDIEGDLKPKKEFAIPVREDIENILSRFRGEIKQIPPQFSAIKKGGKKAYEEARAGRKIELEARTVLISRLETIWYRFPILNLEVACGSGTYVRSLVRDIGEALGTGAVLSALRRSTVGSYRLDDAVGMKKINAKNWKKFLETD